MGNKQGPVFVWREKLIKNEVYEEPDHRGVDWLDRDYSYVCASPCIYCGGPVIFDYWNDGDAGTDDNKTQNCELCGWSWKYYKTSYSENTYENILRQFDINSANLSLKELGSYLSSNYRDVDGVSGRTFERLIGDVFANQGYQVELTKSTRDGGYDIILLGGSDGPIIVEVKRMRKPVGVSLVRQLRGVQVRDGIGKAMLVTSGRFSGPARKEANAPLPEKKGYNIELLDADDILRYLDTYRTQTFSLKSLKSLRKVAWSKYDRNN